jgi:ferredoxin
VSGDLALLIDRTACTGHGLCAELLPEVLDLDEWGYPLVPTGPVPARLEQHARRAVTACPVLALRLEKVRVSRG